MESRKSQRRIKIKLRIRKKISGTSTKPRLSVFRSNTGIYAQLIDDFSGVTLASASSREVGAKSVNKEASKKVGAKIAEVAKSKGITAVVFDRNGYLYHGNIQALAEGARESGLTF